MKDTIILDEISISQDDSRDTQNSFKIGSLNEARADSPKIEFLIIF